MEMSKKITYRLGCGGLILSVASGIGFVVGLKIWEDQTDTIFTIAFILFGIGIIMVLVPVIFGHLPRKNESLDINYYNPPRH